MLSKKRDTRNEDRRGKCYGPCGDRIYGVGIMNDVRMVDAVGVAYACNNFIGKDGDGKKGKGRKG